MFRVLGIYNFGGYQEHLQQTSKSDESRSKVPSDYSINYSFFFKYLNLRFNETLKNNCVKSDEKKK